MRAAQRKYFRGRDPRYLHESKLLERAVDVAVERLLDGQQAELAFPEAVLEGCQDLVDKADQILTNAEDLVYKSKRLLDG
jgi:hypothetical protein